MHTHFRMLLVKQSLSGWWSRNCVYSITPPLAITKNMMFQRGCTITKLKRCVNLLAITHECVGYCMILRAMLDGDNDANIAFYIYIRLRRDTLNAEFQMEISSARVLENHLLAVYLPSIFLFQNIMALGNRTAVFENIMLRCICINNFVWKRLVKFSPGVLPGLVGWLKLFKRKGIFQTQCV